LGNELEVKPIKGESRKFAIDFVFALLKQQELPMVNKDEQREAMVCGSIYVRIVIYSKPTKTTLSSRPET
jgi:hypothetical protein